MAEAETPDPIPAGPRTDGLAAPLRLALFRRIWIASVFSNLGILIQGVGAAWTMTQLTSAADLVALVQSAQMAPSMLLALAAGAIADMFDRRKVALLGLGLSFAGAVGLTVMEAMHVTTPGTILALCFLIGSGMALFAPAWQASVSEQVPAETLPAAIALNSISYNIARSFGPAIGGVVVALAGSAAAFGLNALFYIPLILVLYGWRRAQEPSRLPPERLGRAIVSGVRYVIHAPAIRIVTIRSLLTGVCGGAIPALLPLVTRETLRGDAKTYGLLLGAYGIGAVAAALSTPRLRRMMTAETSTRITTLLLGLSTASVALSASLPLTMLLLFMAGGSWMATSTLFNVGVQFSAPRWVAGRALAAFQAAIAGGIAIGAWVWGLAANTWNLEVALLMAAGLAAAISTLGIWLPMPPIGGRNEEEISTLADPEVQLALTGRSGPIIIALEYRVALDQARAFYRAMQEVQLVRQRNGGYGWSLSRDIHEPELWVESFTCPTWHDYLRQRSRTTQPERAKLDEANGFHMGPKPVVIHRRLERPLGSVRWKEEAPDRDLGQIMPTPASPTGAGS